MWNNNKNIKSIKKNGDIIEETIKNGNKHGTNLACSFVYNKAYTLGNY